ncbi:MAG: hypothetical protein ACTHJW_15465, partial [Streptosporangiaceae bacterium]
RSNFEISLRTHLPVAQGIGGLCVANRRTGHGSDGSPEQLTMPNELVAPASPAMRIPTPPGRAAAAMMTAFCATVRTPARARA